MISSERKFFSRFEVNKNPGEIPRGFLLPFSPQISAAASTGCPGQSLGPGHLHQRPRQGENKIK
jgi:hypothetical protein